MFFIKIFIILYFNPNIKQHIFIVLVFRRYYTQKRRSLIYVSAY